MAVAFLIIGLCGSGKTHLAKDMIKRNAEFTTDPLSMVLIDDPKDLKEINECIELGANIIVCDPHLCDAKNREAAKKYLESKDYRVWEYFFENDPEQCHRNIVDRDDGRYITLAGLKSFNYTIPENTIATPVYRPT